jgi:putative phage-type endonuclease
MMMLHPATQRLLARAQVEQRTPAWYAVRRELLTASDAAAALGVKPYESFRGCARAQCLKRKLDDSFVSNAAVAHGQAHEDEARDLAMAAVGDEAFDVGLVVHATLPWLAASPDGVTRSGRLIEIKCPLRRAIVPGHVPEHYFPQVQVQMEVCDVDSTFFVQYRPAWMPGGFCLDVCVVERDRAWFAANQPRLRAFFDEYAARRPTHVRETPRCAVVDSLYDV